MNYLWHLPKNCYAYLYFNYNSYYYVTVKGLKKVCFEVTEDEAARIIKDFAAVNTEKEVFGNSKDLKNRLEGENFFCR